MAGEEGENVVSENVILDYGTVITYLAIGLVITVLVVFVR
jgi:hypothetical protein